MWWFEGGGVCEFAVIEVSLSLFLWFSILYRLVLKRFSSIC